MNLMVFLNAYLINCFVCAVAGSNHMYFLVNPGCTEKSEGTPDNVDWEFAQKEIAQAKGFATGFGSGLSKGNHIVSSVLFLELKVFWSNG